MEPLIIVLLAMNLVTTLVAATSIKKLIKRKSEDIKKEIEDRTTLLAYDIKLVDNQTSKEKIREAIKGELSDEIRKLAFTPITWSRR